MHPMKNKDKVYMLLSVGVWLMVWQAASMVVQNYLLLPSPYQVLQALLELIQTVAFWKSSLVSLVRIFFGFFAGLLLGMLLAGLAYAFSFVEILLRPLMVLVKAIPVASFIILALVWISSQNLSVFISFTIVLPVVYAGTFGGLQAADPQLLEMAKIFRVSKIRTVKFIYLPALSPFLLTACELALGLSWKSGVAAEVIGLPQNSIGERLYQAKIFFMTPELFAWTVIIILLSWGFSKSVLLLLRKGMVYIAREKKL